MASQTIGVYKETAPGERRVALIPETIGQIRALGLDVLIETGAGNAAGFPDIGYVHAGAKIVSWSELFATADILVGVQKPNPPLAHRYRAGQILIGLLDPLRCPLLVRGWADQKITAISLDMLPPSLSHATPMDAVASQAQLTGYTAALVAANYSSCGFPVSITAEDEPARVLVIGAGAAGLQAITTARRLGATVHAYDPRTETRADVTALGARYVESTEVQATPGSQGHAQTFSAVDHHTPHVALLALLPSFDVVIITAQPPAQITLQAIRAMQPGSVIVDTIGSVDIAAPDATTVLDRGVTIVRDSTLAAKVPASASVAYARNITALLKHVTRDGALKMDTTDAIQAAMVITHDSMVLNDAVLQLINNITALAGMP